MKNVKMASKKLTRKWEVFAGRNKFWCDGRLMTAPHSGVFILTIALICGTCILFFIFDCPFLTARVSPAIPCVGGALFIFTMSALLRTSFSDPGIIPRATLEEASYIEKQIEVPNSCNSPTLRPPPRTREILVRGQSVKLKYCFTCKMFRPPRASHCSLCDNCVDRFDHHCPWVGNCVGRRNYRYFYMFIVALAFLAVYVFACAVTHLVMLSRGSGGLVDALRQSPASAVVCCVCFFSVWSVLGLAGFHTYLASTDQTTNEDIKGSFSSKRGHSNPNPYSEGNVCKNCWNILCGPVAPSLIDRRGVYTIEYKDEIACNPIQVSPRHGEERLVFSSLGAPHPQRRQRPAESEPAATPMTTLTPSSHSISPSPPPPPPPLPASATTVGNGYLSGSYTNLYSDDLHHQPPIKSNHPHAYFNHSLDLDPVPFVESCGMAVGVASGAGAVAAGVGAGGRSDVGGGLSASRLRLLHDTTMIDAALDLDSIEGCGANQPSHSHTQRAL